MSTPSQQHPSVEIVPCQGAFPSYRWILRRADGTTLRHSPYAFSTEKGALISADCWRRELADSARR